MPGARRSARQAAQTSSSPPPTAKSASSSTKRKADDSSPATTKAKRGRPSKASKEQKTLEETMPDSEEAREEQNDEEMKEVEAEAEAGTETNSHDTNGEHKADDEVQTDDADKMIKEPGESFKGETKDGESKADPEKALKDSRGGAGLNALHQVAANQDEPGKSEKEPEPAETEPVSNQEAEQPAVQEDNKREQAQPDNIMEKGIIYFFTRGRVGIVDPSNPQELQRSYFVLRPLPPGGKITEGAVQDVSNNRLIALPKKVWPKSGRDRFMVFVEKAGTSMDTLREEFFQGSDYSTKTKGTRHTPEVIPVGEGVYAMTWTGEGRTTTHLSYMLTIPQEIGEVQKDVGLAEKGSFVMSTKNPESSGPANAQLPQGPGYPKEMIEEFGSRGWLPTKPEHLDYANGQVLLIGESFSLEATQKDARDDNKETPEEELEKLEHENDLRIQHMEGDDTVFADLGISSKDYPKVKSTW